MNPDEQRPGERRSTPQRMRLLSSVAMLAIAVGGVWFWSARTAAQVFQLGADAYIRCAVAARPDTGKSRTALGDSLGPQLAAAGQLILVSAGPCTADGREFTSIVLKRGNSLVSVALTKRTDQDALPRILAGKVVESAGVAIHSDERNGADVATFEAGTSLVFVVSNLGEEQNRELGIRFAPVVARSAAL